MEALSQMFSSAASVVNGATGATNANVSKRNTNLAANNQTGGRCYKKNRSNKNRNRKNKTRKNRNRK